MRTYLSLEELVRRDNPSITFSGGVITVIGTDGPDAVYAVTNQQDFGVDVFVVDRATNTLRESAHFGYGGATHMEVSLLGGNDLFANSYSFPLSNDVDAGSGNDYLNLGHTGGTILGGDGDDTIVSKDHTYYGGTFFIDGGAGADRISLSYGPETVANAEVVYNFDPSEDRFAGEIG